MRSGSGKAIAGRRVGSHRRDAACRKSAASLLGAADWLSLAAAPTFAIMAVLAVLAASPNDMLCSAMHGTSPLGGMVPMYILMSVFHAAPWLRLVPRVRRPNDNSR